MLYLFNPCYAHVISYFTFTCTSEGHRVQIFKPVLIRTIYAFGSCKSTPSNQTGTSEIFPHHTSTQVHIYWLHTHTQASIQDCWSLAPMMNSLFHWALKRIFCWTDAVKTRLYKIFTCLINTNRSHISPWCTGGWTHCDRTQTHKDAHTLTLPLNKRQYLGIISILCEGFVVPSKIM